MGISSQRLRRFLLSENRPRGLIEATRPAWETRRSPALKRRLAVGLLFCEPAYEVKRNRGCPLSEQEICLTGPGEAAQASTAEKTLDLFNKPYAAN
jgi:hypothetical protein